MGSVQTVDLLNEWNTALLIISHKCPCYRILFSWRIQNQLFVYFFGMSVTLLRSATAYTWRLLPWQIGYLLLYFVGIHSTDEDDGLFMICIHDLSKYWSSHLFPLNFKVQFFMMMLSSKNYKNLLYILVSSALPFCILLFLTRTWLNKKGGDVEERYGLATLHVNVTVG